MQTECLDYDYVDFLCYCFSFSLVFYFILLFVILFCFFFFFFSYFILFFFFFFFNDTATTEIYTLSLHDALPISIDVLVDGGIFFDVDVALRNVRFGLVVVVIADEVVHRVVREERLEFLVELGRDRKSTRLNSSHSSISYAVFCLKKKNK